MAVAPVSLVSQSRVTPNVSSSGLPPNAFPNVVHSPLFHVADGVFNNGESPMGQQGGVYVDHGGFLDLDDTLTPTLENAAGVGTVHRLINPNTTPASFEGWTNQSSTIPANGPIAQIGPGNILRLRGYFRDLPLAAGTAVDDGAFEVIADPVFDPNRQTIIVIYSPGTIGYPPLDQGRSPEFGRFAYWGFDSFCGLPGERLPPPPPPPPPPPEASYSAPIQNAYVSNSAFLLKNSGNILYNIVCARAVSRLLQRPMVHQVQRNLELVKAVQLILRSQDSTWRPTGWSPLTADVPVVIRGDSFGGYVAQVCATFFPNNFHGAFSTAMPISARRGFGGEQESWDYIMALSGFVNSGRGYNQEDLLHWGRLLWEYEESRNLQVPDPLWNNWSPFFHTSMTRLFRDGRLPRPVYFQVNDEDPTCTGTDSLSLFDGARSDHDHGFATAPNGVKVYWSVAKKRCHDGGFCTTAINNVGTWDLNDHLFEFVAPVVQSFQNSATYLPPQPANDTEDPYAALRAPLFVQPVQPSTPLTLDPTFGSTSMASVPANAKRATGKLWGSGTFLGGRDSLKIYHESATNPNEDVVYAGSAEGVVTRFKVDPVTFEMRIS